MKIINKLFLIYLQSFHNISGTPLSLITVNKYNFMLSIKIIFHYELQYVSIKYIYIHDSLIQKSMIHHQ